MKVEELSADGLAYRRTFVVPCDPLHAFKEFTSGQGGWWPHDHRRGPQPVLGIGFEPAVGGDWYERSIDGSRVRRGKVLVWDPPRRVVGEWPLMLGVDASIDEVGTSELDVRFNEHREGATRVDLEHRGMHFNTRPDFVRRMFFSPYGWDLVVDNFSAYLASEPWR
ncbi:hypothetical protein [Actinomadura rugatobispora]|uniref:ATPase n=1 Tax=Actinomadura rugatobispora TaxID=1994 RepID=A0ABW0ZRG5_9ACTN|nr:hypothetical protein GCM10010200_001740 [Actinomadura rugatobispora]